MIVFKTTNNSAGKPNYSQRMNPDDPSTPWNETMETCNVTAAATAIVTAGWDEAKIKKGFSDRLPVDILYFMRSSVKCKKLYETIDPQHTSPMNEYMDILALAVLEYLDNRKVTMRYGADIGYIHERVMAGDGIVVHGEFLFKRQDGTMFKGGHYESLAGIVCDENGSVLGWTMDDPYGDPNTQYVNKIGNDVYLDIPKVMSIIKPIRFSGKDAIFIPKFCG